MASALEGRRLTANVVVGACIALPFLWPLHGAIRILGSRVVSAIDAATRWLPIRDLDEVSARDLARGVNAVGHRVGLGDTSCLARSVLSMVLVRAYGGDPEIALGIGSEEAHAWVQMNGVPVSDPLDISSRYPSFDRPLVAARRA